MQMAEKSSNVKDNVNTRANVSASDVSTSLSNFVFDNPRDFLNVLIENHSKIGTYHDTGTTTTAKDYEYAATHSTDPKLAAAASIAFKHFDELSKMDDTTTSPRPNYSVDITNLKHALKYEEGKSLATQMGWQETKYLTGTAFMGLVTVASGALTVASALELPLLSAGMAVGTASGALITGMTAIETYKYPRALLNRAADTKAKLASWPEINSQLRKS